MEFLTSEKLKVWTKKDIVLNIVVYAVNILVLCALFIVMLHLRSIHGVSKITVAQFMSNSGQVINFTVLLALAVMFMAFYFIFEQSDFIKEAANSEMIFLMLEVSLLAVFASGEYINIYIRPLALAAILTLFLTDTKTAVFVNIVFCLLSYLFDSFSGVFIESYERVYFLIMGFSSGIIAIYMLNTIYSRLKIILTSFIISVPCMLCLALPFVWFGSSGERFSSLAYGVFSGPFAVTLFMLLLPIFEGVFTKVSCFKYAELTDHKSKFIRKMIVQAPGTFNHSIIVSNIAEACATAIGEDALLARTCAYYHDVGKLRRPEFFKENQADGFNPHDDITPELSANIIKAHGVDGYKLIKKNRLPQEIADVCIQHHGTMPIIYFYDKAKKFTDGEVDIMQYCYAGPKPQTKIAAIVMLADSSEAITRTLKDRSRKNVNEVVKKTVSDRMQLGQFDECEITLKELNIIINTITNTLTGVYHDRVKYPKMHIEGLAELENEDK